MKESEKATIYGSVCDSNALKPAEIYQLELEGRDERRNHKAFDGFSMNIENGTVDSQGHEDESGFSDAACCKEKVPNSGDHGSLATELTDESKELHFEHNGFSNPFLDRRDHPYMDKKVLEYDDVKDICVDVGIHEEKTNADDVSVRNGYKSTNPFLEPDEGEEDSCEHITKGINDADDFITSDPREDRSSTLVGNECDGTDRGTLSDQQVPEGSKDPFSRAEEAAIPEEEDTKSDKDSDPRLAQVITREEGTTTENVQKEHPLVAEEDAKNPKESSNDHRRVHCDDEAQESSKEQNFYQKKSPLQPDDGDTSFSGASLVEYSGPVIAYSGSISHRSDASTASCRSFAFPILQQEWDTSPVRMTKADKRPYRKRKGSIWGLLCCRF